MGFLRDQEPNTSTRSSLYDPNPVRRVLRANGRPANESVLDLSSLPARTHVTPAGGGQTGDQLLHARVLRFNLNPFAFRVPGTNQVQTVQGRSLPMLQVLRETAVPGQHQLVSSSLHDLLEEINANPDDLLGNFHRAQRLTRALVQNQAIGLRNAGAVDIAHLTAAAHQAAGQFLRPGAVGDPYLAESLEAGGLRHVSALSLPLPREAYSEHGMDLGGGRIPSAMRGAMYLDSRQQLAYNNPMLSILLQWDSDGDILNGLRAHRAGGGMGVFYAQHAPAFHTTAGFQVLPQLDAVREWRLYSGNLSTRSIQGTTSAPHTLARNLRTSATRAQSAERAPTNPVLRDLAREVLADQQSSIGVVYNRLQARNFLDALIHLQQESDAVRQRITSSDSEMAMYMAEHRDLVTGHAPYSAAYINESIIKSSKRGKSLAGTQSVDVVDSLLWELGGLSGLTSSPKRWTRGDWDSVEAWIRDNPVTALRSAAARGKLGVHDAQDLALALVTRQAQAPGRVRYLTLPRAQVGKKTVFAQLREMGVLDVHNVGQAQTSKQPSAQIFTLRNLQGEVQHLAGAPYTHADGRVLHHELMAVPQIHPTAPGQFQTLSPAQALEVRLEQQYADALHWWDPRTKRTTLAGDVQGTVFDPQRVLAGDRLSTQHLSDAAQALGTTPERLRILAQTDIEAYRREVFRYQVGESYAFNKLFKNFGDILRQDLHAQSTRTVHDPRTRRVHVTPSTEIYAQNTVLAHTGRDVRQALAEDVEDDMLAIARQVGMDFNGATVAGWWKAPESVQDIAARLHLGHRGTTVYRGLDARTRVNPARVAKSTRQSVLGVEHRGRVLLMQLDPEFYVQHLQSDARAQGTELSAGEAQHAMRRMVGDTQKTILGAEYHAEDVAFTSTQFRQQLAKSEAQAGFLTPEEIQMSGSGKLNTLSGTWHTIGPELGHRFEVVLDADGRQIPVHAMQTVESVVKRGTTETVLQRLAQDSEFGAHYTTAYAAHLNMVAAEHEQVSDFDLIESVDRVRRQGPSGTLRVWDAQDNLIHEQHIQHLNMYEEVFERVHGSADVAVRGLRPAYEDGMTVTAPSILSDTLVSLNQSLAYGVENGSVTARHAVSSALDQVVNNYQRSDLYQMLEPQEQLFRDLQGTGALVNRASFPASMAVPQAAMAAEENITQRAAYTVSESMAERLGFGVGHVASTVLQTASRGTRQNLAQFLEKHAMNVLGQFLE